LIYGGNSGALRCLAAYSQNMQQTATAAPSSGSASFAGIMSALAGPAKKPVWNDDGLADDVATLSYERALRTHSRYKGPELGEEVFNRSDYAFTEPLDPDVLRFCEAIPVEEDRDTHPVAADFVSAAVMDPEPNVTQSQFTANDRNLKCASITIRLSKTECAQLRRRAAEAGLTVSAYLRSCTFEAESLRALVKDTLAQLRTANPAEDRKPAPSAKSTRFAWIRRLWPYPENRQQAARA